MPYFNNFATNYNTPYYCNLENNLQDSLRVVGKVKRIKKNDTAYIIDIEANNNKYTIISLKCDTVSYSKIKKNKCYIFEIYEYFHYKIVGDIGYIKCSIDNVTVEFKGDRKTGVIVTSPNLLGLYYTPQTNAVYR